MEAELEAEPNMSSRLRSPRLTRKGAMTRDRIVAAATGLIAARGVAGTSTEQVRAAAGVSGSQLYHYFDGKQSLVRAVIASQADEAVGDSLLQDGALNSFEALHAWAEATLERQQRTDGPRCDLSTLAGELAGAAAAREDLIEGFGRWQQALRSGLEDMRSRGVLRPEADLDELATILLTALHGGSQLATVLGRMQPMRAALKSALHYVESFAALDDLERG